MKFSAAGISALLVIAPLVVGPACAADAPVLGKAHFETRDGQFHAVLRAPAAQTLHFWNSDPAELVIPRFAAGRLPTHASALASAII